MSLGTHVLVGVCVIGGATCPAVSDDLDWQCHARLLEFDEQTREILQAVHADYQRTDAELAADIQRASFWNASWESITTKTPRSMQLVGQSGQMRERIARASLQGQSRIAEDTYFSVLRQLAGDDPWSAALVDNFARDHADRILRSMTAFRVQPPDVAGCSLDLFAIVLDWYADQRVPQFVQFALIEFSQQMLPLADDLNKSMLWNAIDGRSLRIEHRTTDDDSRADEIEQEMAGAMRRQYVLGMQMRAIVVASIQQLERVLPSDRVGTLREAAWQELYGYVAWKQYAALMGKAKAALADPSRTIEQRAEIDSAIHSMRRGLAVELKRMDNQYTRALDPDEVGEYWIARLQSPRARDRGRPVPDVPQIGPDANQLRAVWRAAFERHTVELRSLLGQEASS